MAAYRGALGTWNWRTYGSATLPAVLRNGFSREGPSVRLFHDQYVTCTDAGVNYSIALIAGEGNPRGESNGNCSYCISLNKANIADSW
jgi:hypothetical protein